LQSLLPGNSILNILDIVISVYVFFSIFAMISFNQRMQKYTLPLELSFWILPLFSIIPLIIIGLFVSLPIGNMAHLGGFFAGIFYGLYLKNKYPNKTQYARQYFQ